MRFVAVLACVIAAASAAPNTWALPRLDGRVVGGGEVTITDFPYIVSLLYYGNHICGASIISNKYILTAAQCVYRQAPEAFSIRAGSAIRNEGGIEKAVIKIDTHPNYNGNSFDCDVAVLTLYSELQFGDEIQPTMLADAPFPEPDWDVVVAGWGLLTEISAEPPSNLHAVGMRTVSDEDCKLVYGEEIITPRMMCAGEVGKDACHGDSGGPLNRNGKNGPQYGIVIFGYGCARPGYPGVYTAVHSVRDFIFSVANV